jgi:hypothetical protein
MPTMPKILSKQFHSLKGKIDLKKRIIELVKLLELQISSRQLISPILFKKKKRKPEEEPVLLLQMW